MSTEDRTLAVINRISECASTADKEAQHMRSAVLHPKECKLLLDYITMGAQSSRSDTMQNSPHTAAVHSEAASIVQPLLRIIDNLSKALMHASQSKQ